MTRQERQRRDEQDLVRRQQDICWQDWAGSKVDRDSDDDIAIQSDLAWIYRHD